MATPVKNPLFKLDEPDEDIIWMPYYKSAKDAFIQKNMFAHFMGFSTPRQEPPFDDPVPEPPLLTSLGVHGYSLRKGFRVFVGVELPDPVVTPPPHEVRMRVGVRVYFYDRQYGTLRYWEDEFAYVEKLPLKSEVVNFMIREKQIDYTSPRLLKMTKRVLAKEGTLQAKLFVQGQIAVTFSKKKAPNESFPSNIVGVMFQMQK